MNRERALRAGLFGVGGFAVGYLLPGTMRWPAFVYEPVSRTLTFSASVTGTQMRYYGDLLWACAFGLCAAFAAWALQPRRTPLSVAAGTALSLVALDVAFYLSRLLLAV